MAIGTTIHEHGGTLGAMPATAVMALSTIRYQLKTSP
jgi:hypothetical protein